MDRLDGSQPCDTRTRSVNNRRIRMCTNAHILCGKFFGGVVTASHASYQLLIAHYVAMLIPVRWRVLGVN